MTAKIPHNKREIKSSHRDSVSRIRDDNRPGVQNVVRCLNALEGYHNIPHRYCEEHTPHVNKCLIFHSINDLCGKPYKAVTYRVYYSVTFIGDTVISLPYM